MLLNKLTKINADLAEDIKSTGSLITAGAQRMNTMARRLLSLSNEDLTEWLNSQPIQDTFKLFDDHLIVGTKINESVEAIGSQLAASGIPFTQFLVDVRPFGEKLAEQGRLVKFENGVFTVENVPVPEPEPEPQPEPQPEPEPEPEPEPDPDQEPDPIV